MNRPFIDDDRTAALVAGAQRKDPEALRLLIEEHLPDLRAYVRLQLPPRLRRRESCSDIVQSTCREVLEDLPSFEYRGMGSFRAWLFTAALNKVRGKGKYHRAQKRDVAREMHGEAGNDRDASVSAELYASLCSPEPRPSQHAIAREQAARIELAMDRLPSDDREMLLLARVVGLTRRDIAERVGITEKAVRNRVSRASVRLLASLENRL